MIAATSLSFKRVTTWALLVVLLIGSAMIVKLTTVGEADRRAYAELHANVSAPEAEASAMTVVRGAVSKTRLEAGTGHRRSATLSAERSDLVIERRDGQVVLREELYDVKGDVEEAVVIGEGGARVRSCQVTAPRATYFYGKELLLAQQVHLLRSESLLEDGVAMPLMEGDAAQAQLSLADRTVTASRFHGKLCGGLR